MTQKRKVLVFGGTGFIGSALMKLLISRKEEFEIWLLAHNQVAFQEYEEVKIIAGSLTSFDLKWLDIIDPDYIIHLARISGSGKWGRRYAAQNGKRANQRTIDYLVGRNLRPKVIYVSGTLVYGDQHNQIVDETFPIHPTGFAKEYIIAEQPWMHALENNSLPVSIVRPPWIMGQGSWFKVFFLNRIKKDGVVPLFGDGQNWMTLLDVKDCASLILHYLIHAPANRYYNLYAPGCHLRFSEYVTLLSDLCACPVVKISKKDAIDQFGKATYEAFTFSLKSGTVHEDILNAHNFKRSSIMDILKFNLNTEIK